MNSQAYMLGGLLRCCVEAVPSIDEEREIDDGYRPCPHHPDDPEHGVYYHAERDAWRSTTARNAEAGEGAGKPTTRKARKRA